MSNTSMEDLLAQIQAMFKKHCLEIKEIIEASIARIDSIMSNMAEEETSAKEAKESSYEEAENIKGKESGGKKENLLSQQVEPEKVLVVCWEKFVATLGANRTHKLALASDFQEGLIRPLIFKKNSQNNTVTTTLLLGVYKRDSTKNMGSGNSGSFKATP
ncbi:hypothetical protein Tco_1105991 [Tanacetum coccineum]